MQGNPASRWGTAPGGIRTPDRRIRNPLLYPTELRRNTDKITTYAKSSAGAMFLGRVSLYPKPADPARRSRANGKNKPIRNDPNKTGSTATPNRYGQERRQYGVVDRFDVGTTEHEHEVRLRPWRVVGRQDSRRLPSRQTAAVRGHRGMLQPQSLLPAVRDTSVGDGRSRSGSDVHASRHASVIDEVSLSLTNILYRSPQASVMLQQS